MGDTPSLSATQTEREAMDREMSLAAAFDPWSPATSQRASARIVSSVASSGSLGRVCVDQDLQNLADGPFSADGFCQRQVGLDLVAVATAVLVLDDVAGQGQVVDDAVSTALG